MKLEISVEGQEPLIHKIKSQKILIGSGSDCDIVLQADGISRKHAAIHSEDDKFFIIDQGSTNGSFINEERLTPGSKSLFTTFFPVKLGFHVTVTLMDDDDADAGSGFSFAESLKNPEPSIKNTSSAPASRLKASAAGTNKTSTKTLELSTSKSKKAPVGKRPVKAVKSEDEKKMGSTKLLAFLLIAGSVAYFFWDKKQTEQALISSLPPKVEDEIKKVETQLVQQSYLGPEPKGTEAGANAVNIMKCSFPIEKKACEAMQLPHKEFSITGMVMTANAYVFVLPDLLKDGRVFDTFREELGWSWEYRPLLNQVLDSRVLAGLYLIRSRTSWGEIAEEDKREWIYVLFVNQQGARSGDFLFAKAAPVLEALSASELSVNIQSSASIGISPIDNIGGFFRRTPE